MQKIQRSSKAARGTVTCDNTTMHLLKANDFVADSIRKQMAAQNILLLNITSSAGSGKTTLLQETERDADRLRAVGGDALQIVTGGICHLEAQMVWQAMESLNLDGVDLLIIENVGNLVCPASFDLGEDYRVTLIATTEGDDKPKKYPRMFLTSELMLVSKVDLLEYLPFSVDNVVADARDINPDIDVMELSTINGTGVDAWCNWLLNKVAEKKEAASLAAS
jgi:hydrogenase nickel incorporation protein HypB